LKKKKITNPEKILIDTESHPIKRGRGRPKKTELQRLEEVEIEEEGKNLEEYYEEMEKALEEKIQENIVIRTVKYIETDEEEKSDEQDDGCELNDDVNNCDDEECCQSEFIAALMLHKKEEIFNEMVKKNNDDKTGDFDEVEKSKNNNTIIHSK
jgi:hypothetical protein